MCDPENGYLAPVIIYLVDDAVVTDADAPTTSVRQSAATRRTRFFGESLKSRIHTVLRLCGEASYLFLCPALYTYRVGHQSPVTLPSRISRMACSSGTTSLSPLWSAVLASS
jgi:hypothetical protein